MNRRVLPFALLLALACGPTVPVDGGETGVIDDGADDNDTFGGSQPDPSAPTSMTSSDPTGNDVSTAGPIDTGDAVTTDEAGGFITGIDGGTQNIECDLWEDDCPRGFKCMPWANDGGNSWNATKCTPLAEDPNAPGEPCTVVDNGVSGIDDCEARAMCWNVAPDTNMGECVAFCGGSEANPICDDACTHCTINAEGVLILCLPLCDPLAQDCYEGAGCYPTDNGFDCVPDAGGATGALGDPCEYLNVCDPGLLCGSPEWVPGCRAPGCCTPICDALVEDPCPAMLEGTECVPWFEEGEQPACSSGVVGVCALPEGG